jgi:hypothetical protein
VYGKRQRPRLRCFYLDDEGVQRKHGVTPLVPRQREAAHLCSECGSEVPDHHGTPVLPGGLYTVAEVAAALCDVAHGLTYTEASRRARANYWGRDHIGRRKLGTTEGGQTVADWVGRFGPVIAGHYAESAWPESIVVDSTEFDWTNPRTGITEQLFAILAAWGYPAGSKTGRLWAMAAVPSDNKVAWKQFLSSMPGMPALVVYDGDRAIGPAVKESWPGVPLHLCEHHLYKNAAAALRDDGEHGMGNTFRTLLNDAAHSPEGWAEFRDAVEAARLARTGAWVCFWDKQMMTQTAWRADVPPHYSTGALDPKIADVRQMLERRRWTFRNFTRMNHLLSLMRLHINHHDDPAVWAQLITQSLPGELRAAPQRDDGQLDFRRFRTNAKKQADPYTELSDGSRVYTLRKHPVPPREG